MPAEPNVILGLGGGLDWEDEHEADDPAHEGLGGAAAHADLTGLDEDDHPQYLTEAEADAAYADITEPIAVAHRDDTTDVHDHGQLSGLDGDDHPQYETSAEAQAKVDVHTDETSGAHAASAISFSPAGSIASTDVQAAIEEVASEAGGSHPDLASHDTLGLATQTELDDHEGDADIHHAQSHGNADHTKTFIAVLNRVTADVGPDETNAETDIYSFTVPGGTLGTGNMLRLTIGGYYLNTSGNTRNFVLRVKYGATTLFEDTSANFGNTTSPRSFFLEVLLAADGATNDQVMVGHLQMSAATTPAAGRGEISQSGPQGVFGGDSAEDSTADKVLAVSVTHSASHADLEFIAQFATLELLG